MAYSTIDKSTDHFNIKLYTGNGSDNHGITGVGFQPDWSWLKDRSNANHHRIYDSVRGATKVIYSSLNSAEATASTGLKSFDSDGFTLGTGSDENGNSANFVSWNWKAGGTASSNNNGSITSTVSANTTAGFSIVKYTGTGSAETVGHGLGVAPKMIIVKNLSTTENWGVWHTALGENEYLGLNQQNGQATNSAIWNSTYPTNAVFSIGNNARTGGSNDYVAYCFAEIPGYSKFGTYKGNGYADGTYVNVGFKPAIVILKRKDAGSSNWQLNDTARDNVNIAKKRLSPSTSDPEYTNLDMGDILSNGFKIKQTDQTWNNSSGTYIYMAFGQSLVGSNNIPTTAR